jgi:hypothetical protein
MFTEIAKKFVGQKVAVLCARYQYRGILSEVGTDYLVLAMSTSVERSGISQAVRPEQEDVIGSSIIIKTDAIELFYQPNWVNAPLPGEDTN